jgi:hypothetical protein
LVGKRLSFNFGWWGLRLAICERAEACFNPFLTVVYMYHYLDDHGRINKCNRLDFLLDCGMPTREVSDLAVELC